MISVLLVDDQQLVRSGIVSLLALTDNIRVTHQAGDGQQALATLDKHPVDLVLMDIQMPVMNGIDTVAEITTLYPNLPVIMLTTFDHKQQVNAAVKAGARGYMLKDASLQDLTQAIEKVLQGETLIEPIAKQKIKQGLSEIHNQTLPTEPHELVEPLSKKELEVLRLMSSGFSNQEIADTLFRSTGTIKNQVSSILAKMGTRDRTRAVIKALELGLI